MQNQDFKQIFGAGAQVSGSGFNQNDFPSLDGKVQANVGGQKQQANVQVQGQTQFNQQPMMNQDYNQQQMYGGIQQQMPNQQWGMQQPFMDQFGNAFIYDSYGNMTPYIAGNQWGNAMQQQQPYGGLQQTQSMTSNLSQMSLGTASTGLGLATSAPTTLTTGTATITAPLANTAATTTTTAATTSTTQFNTKATEFVPKGKIVKTTESFPTLGDAITKEPAKKKVVPVTTQVKDEPKATPADPTHGMPKEFFVLSPLNPLFPADVYQNPLMPNPDQMGFIFKHYPEYATNPVDFIIWLYQYAQYNEEQAKMQKHTQEVEGAYKQKPKIGSRPVYTNNKKKGRRGDDDSEEEEDVVYYNKQQIKKPKPQPAPQQKDLTAEQLEKKKKLLQKNQENQIKKRQKEAKSIKTKVVAVADEEIVEVDETRQPASLVFIGHVDAGKSTISGQLMYLMGAVDQRTIQKYKEEAKDKNRESWWLAYVMDVNEEEKAKGKTVEVGRANIETAKKRWTIFDAPGHKNYVPNMIMGAALADFGVLVISAKKGEFESGFDMDGQTREHIQLAKSLGIYKIVIAVNKMDEPSVKWSKDRFNEICTNLKPFIEKCGYDVEKDCVFLPISGLNGDNIKEPMNQSVCNWYQGPTLLEVLDNLEVPPRDPEGPLRIPILDKMRDRGTVIFGKVESGTVKVGDQLSVMPSNLICQVATVYNSKGEAVKYAKPGENVQLRLLNINDENLVNKGDVLCKLHEQMPVSDLFEAEIDVLELLKYKPILSKGYQCILHIHTVADEATIKDIIVSYEKNEKGEITEKQRPQFTQSYARIICRVQMRMPIPLEKHDYLPQMGKFTLRDEGKTIAVGKVLKYKPVKIQTYAAPTTATGSATATTTGGVAGNASADANVKVDADGAEVQINTNVAADQTDKKTEELVFDMDSGEMVTREEYNRRNQARDEMEGIDEDDDEEEDEDEEDDGK